MAAAPDQGRWVRLRRGEIEHAAGGLLVARHQRVLREHLATLGVTRACERNGDHAPAVEERDRPHLRLQHQDVARPHEAVGRDAEAAEIALVEVDRGHDLPGLGIFGGRGPAGEGREHLLVEAAGEDRVGLAAAVPDFLQHGFQLRLGEGALGAIGAGAGAIRRRRIGRAAGAALVGIGLDPGQDRCRLAGVRRSIAGGLGLVGADEDQFHVALELEALERLLVFEFVVAAGVLDRALRAGHARHLVRIWHRLPSRTDGVAASDVASSPSTTALPVSTAASACVCHS